MKAQRLSLAWMLGLVLLAGCGGNRGYLVTPVSLERRLQEELVQADPGWYGSKVALIDVDGLILNSRNTGFFGDGENPVSLLAEKLQKARRDRNVRAVVLRIDSPGGTVPASETMHHLVERFKASGKPVIACITNVGASGGYYVACAAEKILSQPSSITGSIGVVVQTVSFAGTMKLLGISAEAIASGKLKTMGSPLKDLTDEERKVFEVMVTEFYDRFVEVVAAGRKTLDEAKTRKLADGRVYTGRQALELGLVDGVGFLEDAIEAAKAAAGIKRAKVVRYRRPLGYRANVYSAAPAGGSPAMQVNLLNVQTDGLAFLRRPSFLYLWSTDVRPAAAPSP